LSPATAADLALLVFRAGVGAGQWSVDHALGWFDPPGWAGLGIALAAGLGGAFGLLAVYWRPARTPAPAPAAEPEHQDS